MRNQSENAAAFRALHERPGAFIIPNPGMPAQPNCSRPSASTRWPPQVMASQIHLDVPMVA
jgi:hypothetical protein